MFVYPPPPPSTSSHTYSHLHIMNNSFVLSKTDIVCCVIVLLQYITYMHAFESFVWLKVCVLVYPDWLISTEKASNLTYITYITTGRVTYFRLILLKVSSQPPTSVR